MSSGDNIEPSCTGCGAVAGPDGRCDYCRERFGDSDATLNRLTLAVTAVARRLPHVIEGDPAGYHAGLVEAFDGLMVALQAVPELPAVSPVSARAPRPILPPVPPDPCIACGAPAYQQSNGVWTWDHTCEASTARRSLLRPATSPDPEAKPRSGGPWKPRGFA